MSVSSHLGASAAGRACSFPWSPASIRPSSSRSRALCRRACHRAGYFVVDHGREMWFIALDFRPSAASQARSVWGRGSFINACGLSGLARVRSVSP
jgi:hypothetical protein